MWVDRDELALLAELQRDADNAPDLGVLDALPVAEVDLARLPDERARALFDAFRLVIRYDRPANVAHCQVTVAAGTKIDPVTFCVVPPVGVEPTL
jgi:hypothetical protein